MVPGGKRIPNSISRRIILSRCFAQNPPMLLLDNFPSAIGHRAEQLSEIITDSKAKWTSIVASNHKVMASRCDRIIILERGKIAFDGSWSEVQKQAQFSNLFQ